MLPQVQVIFATQGLDMRTAALVQIGHLPLLLPGERHVHDGDELACARAASLRQQAPLTPCRLFIEALCGSLLHGRAASNVPSSRVFSTLLFWAQNPALAVPPGTSTCFKANARVRKDCKSAHTAWQVLEGLELLGFNGSCAICVEKVEGFLDFGLS